MEATHQEWWCVDLGQAVNYTALQLERIAEALLRFTPDVVMGKNRIFLEMGRTKKLFRLDSFQKRVLVLADRESIDSNLWRWGIGKTIPESWVQCRFKTLQLASLPIDSIFDYIDPFAHFQLSRAHQDKIKLFQALGMRTLQDLFQIPHDALLVRFGSMLDQFSKNYFEGARIAWVRFKPHVDLIEQSRWNSDEWVIDSESLIFKIKPLIDRMMSRLYSRHQALKQLEIVLKLDSKAPDRKLVLSFAFPQTSSQLLLKLLREKISFEMQKEPLTDPIMLVTLKVMEATPRENHSLTFGFTNQNEESSEDLREKWMELIAYLGTAFQVETTEHHLPERSWKKVLCSDPGMTKPLDQVAHLFQKRPLKLYHEPIALFRIGMYLKKEEQLWRIREFSCEEKITGYEWDVEETQGFDRTYYRVKVEANSNAEHQEEWWIYKDEILKKIMLHGVYSSAEPMKV